jgi:hypothetical protein
VSALVDGRAMPHCGHRTSIERDDRVWGAARTVGR